MSLQNNTYANSMSPLFAPAGESARNWFQFPALNGTVLLADAAGIQTLQAIGNDLFYNGELLAKANDIQDIAAWSDYPAINNVNMDGFSLVDVSGLTVNNGATLGTLLVSNGITSEANITAPSLQIAGAAIPALGQITTATLAASGQIQAGSVSSTGAISGTAVSGTSLATTGGLDMTNTAVTRASAVNISNAGAAPYGALTSPDGVMLTWNGSAITTGAAGNVAQWANYPAVTSINANSGDINNAGTVNATGVIVGSGSSGLLIANRLTSLAGATDPGMSITAYQGLSVTSDAGNILTTAGAVSGTGNISTTAAGVITNTSTGNINAVSNNFEITADAGLNPLVTPNINLTSKNGNGGQVNITADPGSVAAFGGKVLITANGGQIILPTDPPTTVTVGGLIELDANTGTPGGVYTATSAIKLNAAGINSYAGAIPSVGSLAGYNFIYGSAGVSLCAGLPSSGFQLPGTTYLYGIGSAGFTGVRLQSPNGIGMLSDTYATNLYPLDGDGLIIQGRTLPTGKVTLADVQTLTAVAGSGQVKTDILTSVGGNGLIYNDNFYPGSSTKGVYANFLKPGVADTVGSPNLVISGNANSVGTQNYVEVQNADVIAFDPAAAGSLTGVKSINGAAWPPPTGDASLWSQYPATSIIDVSGYGLKGVGDLSGVVSINGVPYAPTSAADWSQYPATQAVDISNQELINVNNIGFLDNGTIIGAGQISVLASGNLTLASDNSGNVNIGTGNKGDINITTGGTGNDVTIGGDTVRLTGTVAVDVNSTLNMTANNIVNLSQVINSTSGLTLTAFGNVDTTSTSGSIISTASVNNDITATNGAVNITGNTQVDIVAPTINLNGNIIANGTFTGTSVSVTGDVVSSSGSTPYSLNAIGALVNGTQQYDYWVAVNGSDTTGTGSVIRPFASVTRALVATVSISDALPINIRLTAGTYTENPTITRNNTFLVGNVGVADAVILGTVTFDPTATATVSQGMSGITVVGNVVCNDNIAFDINYYIQFCNITSYTVSAINAFSTGTGNNSLIINNTVVTQNITANTAITLNSVRLNAIQAQINNTTTGACVSTTGTGSMSLFGCTLTAAGAATASALVTYINPLPNGTASSFSLNTFTYTAGTAGAAKAAFFFNNAGALAGATTINNNVFALPGAAALIQRPGAGSIAIAFGANTTSIQTIPAAGSGLTYTYTTSTPLRANTLYDSASSAGTANQVLGCSSAGGTLLWRSLTNTSLGAIPQATNATVYQNQPLYYNTTTQALNYIAVADDVIVQPCPATASPAPANRGTTYILTSSGASTFTINNTGGANGLTANDAGWYLYVKNGNGTNGGDITINGSLVSGNTVVHNQTSTQNGQIVIVTWNGTAFVCY